MLSASVAQPLGRVEVEAFSTESFGIWLQKGIIGSLAALTGQMEPVAKFEGSLVELTGAGLSSRMSQSEFEREFGPIVKITG